MNKYLLYPGCSMESSAKAYMESLNLILDPLELRFEEIDDWNCCGAMEVKNVDPKIQTYLSQRVLSIAANEMKADVVMAPCNGCYHNLKKAEYDLGHDVSSREVVDRLATCSSARWGPAATSAASPRRRSSRC